MAPSINMMRCCWASARASAEKSSLRDMTQPSAFGFAAIIRTSCFTATFIGDAAVLLYLHEERCFARLKRRYIGTLPNAAEVCVASLAVELVAAFDAVAPGAQEVFDRALKGNRRVRCRHLGQLPLEAIDGLVEPRGKVIVERRLRERLVFFELPNHAPERRLEVGDLDDREPQAREGPVPTRELVVVDADLAVEPVRRSNTNTVVEMRGVGGLVDVAERKVTGHDVDRRLAVLREMGHEEEIAVPERLHPREVARDAGARQAVASLALGHEVRIGDGEVAALALRPILVRAPSRP